MDRIIPAPHRFSTISLLMLAGLGVATALALILIGVDGRTHALVQLFLFPLVVFLLSRVAIGGVSVPWWVLALSLLGAVGGALFTYTHVDLARGAFVVAPLQGDRGDSDISVRRDRMRRPLGAAGLTLVGTHRSAVSSQHDAETLLDNNQTLGGVVWGSTRWVMVSLSRREPLAISSLPSESFAGRFLRERNYQDLKIATGVGSFGLSDALNPATLWFIGRIVPLWRDFPLQLSEQRDDGALYEQRLRSVVALKERWTSFSHRAVPMWMMGTYHLVRAISSKELEKGELSCAISSFEAARAQLRPSDNLELQSAISNNLAVALLLREATERAHSQVPKVVVKLLKRCLKHEKLSHRSLPASALASFNLSILKGKHAKRQRRKE